MGIVFRSKIDAKFKALALALAAVAFFTSWTRPKGAPAALWTVMDVLMLCAAALAIWITFSTYYELGPDALVARSGPFSWRIALADIISIRPSDSSQSSPAMSMDRLEIRYGDGRSLLVSPADQAEFLAMLHRRLPRLANEKH